MEITEVRIKLMEDNSGSNERLQAFCSITFDDMFVIRDLKIIEGAKGFFVAMPSRKLTDRCHNCGTKNHLRSRFCNQCGCRLDENRALRDADGRAKLHADIAHPINSMCREKIQSAVLASYAEELERAKMPGYVSRYDEYEVDDFEVPYDDPRPGGSRLGQRAAAPPRPVAGSYPARPRQPVGASWTARSAPPRKLGRGNRLGLSSPQRSRRSAMASEPGCQTRCKRSCLIALTRSACICLPLPISSRLAPARTRRRLPSGLHSWPGPVRCGFHRCLGPAFLLLSATARYRDSAPRGRQRDRRRTVPRRLDWRRLTRPAV